MEYIIPSSVEEAVALLVENVPRARPLAGGTDLIVDLKHAPGDTDLLIDVSQLPEFGGIEETEKGLRIGSMVTFSELMASPIVNQMTPEIVAASHTVGAVQTRNLGTIGGNLVTCVPSADSAPSLLALDALATIAGSNGRRSMPLEEFFVGPRKTILESHELLVEILIPRKNLGKPSHFIKFGLRKGQALALVNVAAALYLDPTNGTTVEPRIALGAVAPTPICAQKAEASLNGNKPTEQNLLEAARIAVAEIKPIDDFRASANYRRHLVQTLTYRALKRSVEIAGERQT